MELKEGHSASYFSKYITFYWKLQLHKSRARKQLWQTQADKEKLQFNKFCCDRNNEFSSYHLQQTTKTYRDNQLGEKSEIMITEEEISQKLVLNLMQKNVLISGHYCLKKKNTILCYLMWHNILYVCYHI